MSHLGELAQLAQQDTQMDRSGSLLWTPVPRRHHRRSRVADPALPEVPVFRRSGHLGHPGRGSSGDIHLGLHAPEFRRNRPEGAQRRVDHRHQPLPGLDGHRLGHRASDGGAVKASEMADTIVFILSLPRNVNVSEICVRSTLDTTA